MAEPCTRDLLPRLRAETLAGANVVFSGVIPTDARQPERHEAWRAAEALGACVQPSLRGDQAAPGTTTTHLIAAKYGTHKVHVAQHMRNVSIVNPDWLWCCRARWEHVSEDLFRLRPDHRGSSSVMTSAEHTPSHTPMHPSDDGRHLSAARRDTRHVSLSDEEKQALMKEVDLELGDDDSSDEDDAFDDRGNSDGVGDDDDDIADDDVGDDDDSEEAMVTEEGDAEKPRQTGSRKRQWEDDSDDESGQPSKHNRSEDWGASSSEESGSDDSGSEDDEMASMLEKQIADC